MKKFFSVKKVVIRVVAASCLIGIGIFAVSKITSTISAAEYNDVAEIDEPEKGVGYQSQAADNDIADIDELEKEVGYQVQAVESFLNGYQVSDMRTTCSAVSELGDNENADEIIITYQKGGASNLNLIMEKSLGEMSDREPDTTAQVGGVTLSYWMDTYKYVPEDYELTAEDNANMEKGNYYVSYGSDAVEVQQSSSVYWVKDGITYGLFGFDLGMSSDEMFGMAGEIINQ